MRTVTLKELLAQWWTLPEGVTREQFDAMDWFELLRALGIECPEAEGRNVVIADVDEKTYGTLAVVFELRE